MYVLICCRYPGVSKDKNNWVWDEKAGSNNPEIMNMISLGISRKQVELLLYKIEAE